MSTVLLHIVNEVVPNLVLEVKTPGVIFPAIEQTIDFAIDVNLEVHVAGTKINCQECYRCWMKHVHISGSGEHLFKKIEALNLEGMVMKRKDSVYAFARCRDWLKVRTAAGRDTIPKRIENWK